MLVHGDIVCFCQQTRANVSGPHPIVCVASCQPLPLRQGFHTCLLHHANLKSAVPGPCCMRCMTQHIAAMCRQRAGRSIKHVCMAFEQGRAVLVQLAKSSAAAAAHAQRQAANLQLRKAKACLEYARLSCQVLALTLRGNEACC